MSQTVNGSAPAAPGDVVVSFVCFAPADDPEIIMLLTLDTPGRNTGTYVSGVRSIMICGSSAGAKHRKETTTSPSGLEAVLVPVLSAVPVLPPMR